MQLAFMALTLSLILYHKKKAKMKDKLGMSTHKNKAKRNQGGRSTYKQKK